MTISKVEDYYNAVTQNYEQQYEKDKIFDTSRVYPANYFRMQLLINSFVKKDLKRIIEVGVGEGTPMTQLYKAGFDTVGFDISKSMVEKARKTASSAGMKDCNNRIFLGDIQDSNTYVSSLKDGRYDGLVAMGVMPHVDNDDLVMKNISTIVRPGGSVFIEFRNELFSLFTFNRYTMDFITNNLLNDVDEKLKNVVKEELSSKLDMDQPPVRDRLPDGSPDYDAILSKFHNPLNIHELFNRHGFKNINLMWYHYHPAMPHIKNKDPELFRKESVKMEHEPSGWKGHFLCSAFVVEAEKE